MIQIGTEYESTGTGYAYFTLKEGIHTVTVYSSNLLDNLLYTGQITVTKAETFTIDLDTDTVTTSPDDTLDFSFGLDFSTIFIIAAVGASGAVVLALLFGRKHR